MLKTIFQQLIVKYFTDIPLAESLWQEIENKYSVDRYYHNLHHLENMYFELEQVKKIIVDWDTVVFALFYHDIIYNPASTDNEEKSAEVATATLSAITFPKDQIEKCEAIILATKSHIEFADSDFNYFTDADLSILGQSWEVYLLYAHNIRKEYSAYPDLIYKSGRKKILSDFLKKDRIYKTNFFSLKFEKSARENLKQEMSLV